MEEKGGFLMPADFIDSFRESVLKRATAPATTEAIKMAQKKHGRSPTLREVDDIYYEHFGTKRQPLLEIPKL